MLAEIDAVLATLPALSQRESADSVAPDGDDVAPQHSERIAPDQADRRTLDRADLVASGRADGIAPDHIAIRPLDADRNMWLNTQSKMAAAEAGREPAGAFLLPLAREPENRWVKPAVIGVTLLVVLVLLILALTWSAPARDSNQRIGSASVPTVPNSPPLSPPPTSAEPTPS